jgi:hypothetical protein
MSTSEEVKNHTNATALIVATAKKSGLLREVAEALYFIDKYPNPTFGWARVHFAS